MNFFFTIYCFLSLNIIGYSQTTEPHLAQNERIIDISGLERLAEHAGNKNAAKELFFAKPQFLELLWWRSDNADVRTHCLSLILLRKNVDLLDVPYNRFIKFSNKFNRDEKKKRQEELVKAVNMMSVTAKNLLKEVKVGNIKRHNKSNDSMLKYARYYAKFDAILISEKTKDKDYLSFYGIHIKRKK